MSWPCTRSYCPCRSAVNPQYCAAQMWLWSVQVSSQALAWTPQWWYAASPSGGLIRYYSVNRSVHTLDILTVVFVMVDVVDFFFFLHCAANGRSSDGLHGGIWDQVCMEVCPKQSGQTLLGSSAGHLDGHPHRQRARRHLRLRALGSWWVCMWDTSLV